MVEGRWLYRIGGLCALLLGVAYLTIFPLFARVGIPPSGGGGGAWLKYLEGKTTVWWMILGLSVLTDFLFVPVGLALYVALQRVKKYAMLLGASFMGLFVVLDLAVTWTNYGSLLTLSGLYGTAMDDAQRANYVAAASYASSVLASRTEVFYAVVDLSLGILVISFVMLRSKEIFGKAAGYLGVAAGVSGIFAPAGFWVVIIVNALLTTMWVLFVGIGLLKLGQMDAAIDTLT